MSNDPIHDYRYRGAIFISRRRKYLQLVPIVAVVFYVLYSLAPNENRETFLRYIETLETPETWVLDLVIYFAVILITQIVRVVVIRSGLHFIRHNKWSGYIAFALWLYCFIGALYFYHANSDRLSQIGVIMLFGGATANAFEQLCGSVVDYLPVRLSSYTAVVNLADIFLVVGITVSFLGLIF